MVLKSVSSSQLIATDCPLMCGLCHSCVCVWSCWSCHPNNGKHCLSKTWCTGFNRADRKNTTGSPWVLLLFFSVVDKQFSFLHFFPSVSLTHLFCPPASADQLKSVLLPSRTWKQISAQAFFTILKITRRSFCKRLEKLNVESLLPYELRHRPSYYYIFFCISCGVVVLHTPSVK